MLQRDVETTPQRRGMGTTLTMACVISPRMYVVHVGDSRCYLRRNGNLKQITRDHTLAQLYQDTSELSADGDPSQCEISSRLSNTLWNKISADDADLHPDVYCATLEPTSSTCQPPWLPATESSYFGTLLTNSQGVVGKADTLGHGAKHHASGLTPFIGCRQVEIDWVPDILLPRQTESLSATLTGLGNRGPIVRNTACH